MDEMAYKWIQKLESSLKETGYLSTLENRLCFPLSKLEKALATQLNLPSLTLYVRSQKWEAPSGLLSGMEEDPFIYAFELLPLNEVCFFVLSQRDVATLISHTMMHPGEERAAQLPLVNSPIITGFYEFLLLQSAHVWNDLSLLKQTSLRLSQKKLDLKGKSWCIDLAIELEDTCLEAKIICPLPLMDKISAYGPIQKQLLLEPVNPSLSLFLKAKVGTVTLHPSDLQQLEIGDFIVLDQCSFDPQENQGNLTLFLRNHPLFEIEIDQNSSFIRRFIWDNSFDIQPADFHLPESADSLEDTGLPQELELDLGLSQIETYPSKLPLPTPMTISINTQEIPVLLGDLTQLKVGDLFPLDLLSSFHVICCYDQEEIAKGQLMKMGDIVGVRVLELFR